MCCYGCSVERVVFACGRVAGCGANAKRSVFPYLRKAARPGVPPALVPANPPKPPIRTFRYWNRISVGQTACMMNSSEKDVVRKS